MTRGWSLGIDLGTSSVKVCLLDEKGRRRFTGSGQYQTYSPQMSWMEQDPMDWLKAMTGVIHALVKDLGEDVTKAIGSICLTSAAHIGVLLDDQGCPLRRAILWSDQRSVLQVQELLAREERIYDISGNKPSTSWTLPHLLWVKENEPEVWTKVDRICLSKDFVLHWLCNKWVTDPGTAASSMLYDGAKGCWSGELCSLLGIDPCQLPAIMGAIAPVGILSAEAAKALGVPQGIPLVNGSLDSATETFGAGARKAGDMVIRIGTAGGIHRLSGQPMQNRALLTYPFPWNGIWYSQAGTNAAGSAIGWAVGLDGKKSAESFELFSGLAAQAPAGAGGVLFHPFLAGERTPYWDANLRGTFTGLSFMHTKAHMARAVLEGVAYSLYDALSSIIEKNEIPKQLIVVGGGSLDSLLMRVLSSMLQVSLLPQPFVDSSYGSALMGQLAVFPKFRGVMKNEGQDSQNEGNAPILTEGFDDNKRIVSPVEAWVPVYQEGFQRYKMYCNVLHTLYN